MPGVGIIVLAAGRSVRFGSPSESKLLAMLEGTAIVRHAVSAAIGADVGEVVVVTGDRASEVRAAVDDLPVRIVHEPGFAEGMAASLRRGVLSLGHCEAVLVALGDQPGVRSDAFRIIVEHWRSTGAPIVLPRYAGADVPGHPALFAASIFAELHALHGDTGARGIIAADPTRVFEVALEWPAPRDVDSIDDLRALKKPADPTGSAQQSGLGQHASSNFEDSQ